MAARIITALHVLRILQEEAMKENTAAIHVQVPVDVGTYLLNEKRSEIIKIEARFKAGVILIPNPALETPNYHIERLRHDSPLLDAMVPSYEMVGVPVEVLYDDRGERAGVKFNSRRQFAPFVPINCSALPENLLESELFGHRRGGSVAAVAR